MTTRVHTVDKAEQETGLNSRGQENFIFHINHLQIVFVDDDTGLCSKFKLFEYQTILLSRFLPEMSHLPALQGALSGGTLCCRAGSSVDFLLIPGPYNSTVGDEHPSCTYSLARFSTRSSSIHY
jgi:hypothetical protein